MANCAQRHVPAVAVCDNIVASIWPFAALPKKLFTQTNSCFPAVLMRVPATPVNTEKFYARRMLVFKLFSKLLAERRVTLSPRSARRPRSVYEGNDKANVCKRSRRFNPGFAHGSAHDSPVDAFANSGTAPSSPN